MDGVETSLSDGKLELQPGDYELLVEHEGYKSFEMRLEVNEETRPVEVSLAQELVALTIKGRPKGTEVILNEKARGTTPMTLELTPGDYKMVLKKAGFESEERNLKLRKKPKTEQFRLNPLMGRLKIVSNPKGATVKLNGKKVGVTPFREKREPGPYTVTVAMDKYKAFQQKTTVKVGEETIVRANLERIPPPVTRPQPPPVTRPWPRPQPQPRPRPLPQPRPRPQPDDPWVIR